MRSEIVEAVKAVLLDTGVFAGVCGLSADKPVFPLVRVWSQGTRGDNNLDNDPQARVDLLLGVQIETWLEKDAAGNSVDKPLYDLVDAAFNALHNYKLPGRGSQKLIVHDSPGLDSFDTKKGQEATGDAVYRMTVSVRVIPENFSLT